ncbi:PREDICTED: uncharacterized protein LOC105366027 isoform X2 [Ceratosolen solmsi marchali]|uniref:Uncharacterized protein LOC105366027 isoform X2 n=1 Tax=Ceratosolen solmsi marchali TaxID=326594 RepID=A0AAJ7E000_9HYME|nr:PREDICTED: uncharacterized protein LOC105366027 isoform X2 [Ceratosolen solmsi marchali]
MSSEVSNDSTSILHKIYTSDPILYKSYVNKKVTITTEDSNVHIGFVYTIDPVSESIVLMQPKEGEEKMQLKIIMRGAIKKFECSFDNEFLLPEMFVAPEIHMPEQELMKRKYSVVKLLLENHFPVSEDKALS